MKKFIKIFFEVMPKNDFFISARNYTSFISNYGYIPSKKNIKYLFDYLFFVKNSPASTKYGYFIDKDTVKRFISAFVGEKYVTPTIGVFDKITELEHFYHSEKYVVKPTHMAGRIIIKESGHLNKDELLLAQKWLKENYGKISREYPYINLNAKILVEEFASFNGDVPFDYKFFVVNGKCEMIQVNKNRFSDYRLYLYNRNWEKLNLRLVDPTTTDVEPKPPELEEMLQVAEKIGALFPFVRVDLYITDNGIKFGELTFVPGSALPLFTPRDFDAKLYEKTNPRCFI